MKVLIGTRFVRLEAGVITDNVALEVCTPAVLAVEGSRGPSSGIIRGELERAMGALSECNYGENRTLMFKTEPAAEWGVLTGAELDRGIANLAKRLSEMAGGELYITLPNSKRVEIYKIEEV